MSYRKSLFTIVLLGASLFGLVACSGEDGNMKSGELQLPVLSQAQIDALAGKTFYFAHQSVGYNIVDGVEKVLEKIGHPGLFVVKELKPGEPVPQKGLLHSAIGRNGDPESKMNDFQAFLDKRLGDTQPDMAMLKFCYVDISKKTDVPALVKEYGDAMSRLGEEHPQTLFIYATVPLRVFNHSWKAGIKRLLGMDVWGDEANIKRQVCLRPRDRFWDIPVPKIDSAFDNLLVPQPSWSPSTTQQLRKLVAAPYLSPNDWTPRLDAYFASPLALCARRVSSAASRLLGSTSLRFALHGWQRMSTMR